MGFGMLGGMGRGFGRLGTPLGGVKSGPVAPSAPVLTFLSETGGVLSYSWDVDSSIGTGDTITYQYQTAGAGWVSPTPVPHVILAGEDTANTIPASLTLANGTWDIRGFVTRASDGRSSGFSNVDASRVVTDALTGRLMWGASQQLWSTDHLIWN